MLKNPLLTLQALLASASMAWSCTGEERPDLNSLLHPSVAYVIKGKIEGVEMLDPPDYLPASVPALRISHGTNLLEPSPVHTFSLPMARFRRAEELSSKYPQGTTLVVALDPQYGATQFDLYDPWSIRISGGLGFCNTKMFFTEPRSLLRAIELIFDGEGDPQTEADLFNKLFWPKPPRKPTKSDPNRLRLENMVLDSISKQHREN